jgi:hypothetical protein
VAVRHAGGTGGDGRSRRLRTAAERRLIDGIRSEQARRAREEAQPGDLGPDRLDAVRLVRYLIFSDGYTPSGGHRLHRVDLAAEAIRLTRLLVGAAPGDHESAALLAPMLLTTHTATPAPVPTAP